MEYESKGGGMFYTVYGTFNIKLRLIPTHYFYDEHFPVILDFLGNRVTHHVEYVLIKQQIKQ